MYGRNPCEGKKRTSSAPEIKPAPMTEPVSANPAFAAPASAFPVFAAPASVFPAFAAPASAPAPFCRRLPSNFLFIPLSYSRGRPRYASPRPAAAKKAPRRRKIFGAGLCVVSCFFTRASYRVVSPVRCIVLFHPYVVSRCSLACIVSFFAREGRAATSCGKECGGSCRTR